MFIKNLQKNIMVLQHLQHNLKKHVFAAFAACAAFAARIDTVEPILRKVVN